MSTRRRPYRHVVTALLIACVVLSASLPTHLPLLAEALPTLRSTSHTTAVSAWDDNRLWTRWGAEQYAFAQEGDYLWIGTGSGVLRWHIPTQTPTRYSTIDGLPSHRIFAVAIDPAGNRWFGGDGGLSRLDAAGVWTHFTTANSGLHNDTVNGIAVGDDGTVWLSHGLPDGSVSRRTPDGSWAWSPNRAAMVVSDYAAVGHTQNANPLWVIADGAVWVDFTIYDGVNWYDRTPTVVEGAHPDLMTAWGNDVWALFVEGSIHHWTGTQWERLSPEPAETPNGGFALSTMTVTPAGQLWVAGRARYCIKGCAAAVILFPIDRSSPDQRLDAVTIISQLAPSGDGVWAIGPAWLRSPGGDLYQLTDAPVGDTFTGVIADRNGMVWHSSVSRRFMDINAPAAVQGLDDAATSVLHDDQWQIGWQSFIMAAAARTFAGDLWLALEPYSLFDYLCPQVVLVRRHLDRWITYAPPLGGPTLPYCSAITDIFAQDEYNTWFAYVDAQPQDGTAASGVLHLDDGGTPDALDDDVWTDYPFPALHTSAQLAVNDSIWLATRDALYRWSPRGWQSTGNPADQFLCELTVAAGGYLLAQRDASGLCGQPSVQVSLLSTADAHVERTLFASVDQFLSQHWAIASTATQRHALFALDAEGAIWYFAANSLCHRTGAQATAECTSLPAQFSTLSPLEIDENGHLWFAADGALWRWSGAPSFVVAANPALLWMTPNSTRHVALYAESIEGFAGAVALSVTTPPPQFAATLTPATVELGASASLTLTTTPSVALGEHVLTVQAVGMGAQGSITQSTSITVWVAAEIHELHLPIVARR